MKVAITDFSFPDLDIEEGILTSAGHQLTAWKEKEQPLNCQNSLLTWML